MTAAIEAVIFDFGGVIIAGGGNGAAGSEDTPFTRLERHFSLPPGFIWDAHYRCPAWERLRVGEGTRETWLASVEGNLAERCGAAGAREILETLEASRGQPAFNPGMLDLIGTLSARYRVGLLSNAAPGLEDDLRDLYRIDHLFHDIVNSATVRVAKPAARIYALAAGRLGVPTSACFFTDDLLHNVEGARQAGMMAYHFDHCAGLTAALGAAGVAID
jgi:putative hydrolase of the HAD superfamily